MLIYSIISNKYSKQYFAFYFIYNSSIKCVKNYRYSTNNNLFRMSSNIQQFIRIKSYLKYIFEFKLFVYE